MVNTIDILKTIGLVSITKIGPILALTFSFIAIIFLILSLLIAEVLFYEETEIEKSEQAEEYSLPKFEQCDIVSVDGNLYTLKCDY